MENTARQSQDAKETPELHFRGQVFEPLPSGALFWPAENALLVADLHLEKMSSFARGGQLLPPYDTGMTLSRLEADLTTTRATRLIALGDSFHRDEGTSTLQPSDRDRLSALMEGVDWVWLSGNHDPSPHALGGTCGPALVAHGITLSHEPQKSAVGQIAGHLHPAARVRLNGRSVRRACFVADENLMILPAYGSSTGNLNILSPAFIGLFQFSQLQVVMLGQGRVYSVSPKRLVGG